MPRSSPQRRSVSIRVVTRLALAAPAARVWRAALAGLLETEQFSGLGGVRVPALLIWGDRDGMFSRSEQQALVAAAPDRESQGVPGDRSRAPLGAPRGGRPRSREVPPDGPLMKAPHPGGPGGANRW